MRYPQAFCQQQLQLVAQPLAPMAQVRAFVRKLVLEKLLSGEVLEIRIMHPALADTLVGQSVDVLEQQQPDHESGLNSRPAFVAVERRDLAVDPLPFNLACKQHQLVVHVDDLLEPRSEQIARSRRLMLLRPHRSLRCTHRITPADSRKSSKRNCKLAGAQILKPCNLKTIGDAKSDSCSRAYKLFTANQIFKSNIKVSLQPRQIPEKLKKRRVRALLEERKECSGPPAWSEFARDQQLT